MQQEKSTSNDKKVRRKTTGSSSSSRKEHRDEGRNSNSHNTKQLDPQKNIINFTLTAIEFEENEAIRRTAEQDKILFNKKCTFIRHRLKEMKKAKEKNGSEDKNINRKLDLCMLFLDLKKLNRLDKIRCKLARDQVAEMRQKVDSYHLQLQNLMYEVMHLQKEINKCHEFKSHEEFIDLINVDQFYAEAPPEISRVDETKSDLHKRTLARLQYELEQRKILSSELKEKSSLKEAYLKEIEEEKQRLNSLKPILNTIIEAAEPLNKHLDVSSQLFEVEHTSALYLSVPLYVIYLNASAAKEASEENYFVEINGNVEEAKAIQFSQDLEDDETIEMDTDDRKKRHRKSKSDKRESLSKKITSVHPLTVSIKFNYKEPDVQLMVEFSYLLTLKIVTVKAKVLGLIDNKHNDLLDEKILNDLYPNDDGLKSPNPANAYQLSSIKVTKFSDLVDNVGFAYEWAQSIAGLNFLPQPEKRNQLGTNEYVLNFLNVLKRLKSRFESRIILNDIVSQLEAGILTVPPPLSSKCFDKIICILKKWSPSTLEEWMSYRTGDQLFESKFVTESSLFYEAIIEREPAHLKALVSIPCNYPSKAPIFQLCLNSEKTSENNATLRDLEEFINIYCVEEIEDKTIVLPYQMYSLCVAFDAMLESECTSNGEQMEFQKGRIFLHTKSGRDHRKPLSFDPEFGFFC